MADRTKTIDKHQHFFGSLNRCVCGAFRITHKEFYDQCEVWDAHYLKSKDTDSAKSFWTCYDAWKKKDFATVKDLTAMARERLEKGVYLPKPNYPDPRPVKKDWMEDGYVVFYGQPSI